MGSLWIQTYRLNPSKPSSQESRGFNHGSVKENKIIVNHYSYRLQWSADNVDYVR